MQVGDKTVGIGFSACLTHSHSKDVDVLEILVVKKLLDLWYASMGWIFMPHSATQIDGIDLE
ncbi:unnamed protein product [Sphenostylis stenocarpa]|uniref:Uncharacterized protein n=1 Tax=Sphenostylis stenocarpa TaxID=92480 RepID=A0AA86RYE5_9FABA|nr:unnamed protein product [Sphenostylis stenocarpa]